MRKYKSLAQGRRQTSPPSLHVPAGGVTVARCAWRRKGKEDGLLCALWSSHSSAACILDMSPEKCSVDGPHSYRATGVAMTCELQAG